MKAFKELMPAIFFTIAVMGAVQLVSAQKTIIKYTAIQQMVDSQQYVFYAQYAIPMTGNQRPLTSDYTVSISKDTITADLPYFGQSYSAPINTSDVGIKFTSTDFDYKITQGKKNSWNIIIKPKDAMDVRQFNMTIFENGRASLQVNSTNRQLISFNGYIKEKK